MSLKYHFILLKLVKLHYTLTNVCRLSQWDQKDWKKRLIILAAHVNTIGNATVLLKQVESPKKASIVASAVEVIKGLNTAYEILKKAFTEAETGNAPEDFTASITSPGPLPVPSANTAESTLWFQSVWGSMQIIMNRIGQKCPKIADLMRTLSPSGERLSSELKESFGEASGTGVSYRSMATFAAAYFPEKFNEA